MKFNKYSEIIRPGGLLLIDSHFISIKRKVDARQISLEMYKTIMDKMEKQIILNTCMLGALIGLTSLIKTESMMKVLAARLPDNVLDMNKKAFDIGLNLAKDYLE